MKKPYKNTVLSDKKCIDCNKPLKMNLVVKSIHNNRCYCCHNISKGKFTSVIRYARGTEWEKVKKAINYKEIQKLNIKNYRYA